MDHIKIDECAFGSPGLSFVALVICSGPLGEQRVDLAGLQVRRGGGRELLQSIDGTQPQAVFSVFHTNLGHEFDLLLT